MLETKDNVPRSAKVRLDALKAAGRTAADSQSSTRLRSGLVVVQVALSLVLLTGAGLMIRSLWRLHQIQLGFDPDHVLAVTCVLAPTAPHVTELGLRPASPGSSSSLRRYYAANAPATRFVEQTVERLERLPGVKSAAGAGYGLPFVRNVIYNFRLEGQTSLPREQAGKQWARLSAITPGYFRTLGIRLATGRAFDERDGDGAPGVAIISQSMAKTFWPPGQSVIGKRIMIDSLSRPFEIIGIAADIRLGAKQESAAQIYIPDAQSWAPSYWNLALARRLTFHFVVRTQTDPAALAQAVRGAIREADGGAVVEQIGTMQDVIAESFGPWRSTMLLLGLFAGVAVLLSAIGIYGVISYAVGQRTHEIGVRMALGAGHGEILRLIMKRGILLALTGILIGSVAASWLTQLIATQLFEVTPTDPLTFSGVALLLLGVAALACYLPARRAAALDPMAALRCE